METQEKLSNYQKHLYFEKRTQSKEYALDKCIKVLALIAKLKDRNERIRNYGETYYGKSANGNAYAPESEYIKYVKNIEIIKRLKSYYNYCLSNLKNF